MMGFVQESNGNMLGVGPRADRYAGAQIAQQNLPSDLAQTQWAESMRTAGVVPKPTVEDAVKGAVGRYKGVYEPDFKPKPTASERMIQGMSAAGRKADRVVVAEAKCVRCGWPIVVTEER